MPFEYIKCHTSQLQKKVKKVIFITVTKAIKMYENRIKGKNYDVENGRISFRIKVFRKYYAV
jgi:hypothetical protein